MRSFLELVPPVCFGLGKPTGKLKQNLEVPQMFGVPALVWGPTPQILGVPHPNDSRVKGGLFRSNAVAIADGDAPG